MYMYFACFLRRDVRETRERWANRFEGKNQAIHKANKMWEYFFRSMRYFALYVYYYW